MRSPSLSERAADQIRRRIVTGALRLGEALSETALAAELGISKTPVREAFLLLKTEGLVDIQPQRGTFVFRIDAAEADKLSEFREVLEISALRIAMAKDATGLGQALDAVVTAMTVSLASDDPDAYRDQDALYHQCIIDRCGNHYLSRSYAVVAFRIQALRYRLATHPVLDGESLEQHRALAHSIGRGPRAKAIVLLRRHIAKTRDDYARTIGLGTPSELS
jgi:DNA-binding GntR family transcriptional regulator